MTTSRKKVEENTRDVMESTKLTPKAQNAGYSAPALEKGLDILEVLCKSSEGLTQKEIASLLGRSTSELYRMVNCLERRKYISHEGDKYSITTKLFQLSRIHPPTDRLVTAALPIMQELSHSVGFACDLRVYNNGSQTVIASMNTPSGIGFNVRSGAEIAIAPSASGRVLVAFQPAETTEIRIRESFAGLPASEIKAFRKDLHEVAVKGFASIKSRQYEGVHAISFPILDMDRHAIAALTVPMVPRLDTTPAPSKNDVEERLRESAEKLNRLIR
ncbi:IclR family transcriptional regulator [Roseinatronobacter sp. NSM]|uniref:IclR family transcriptional regulator n=1 Tax=Roseinatronobacter sp. NSM TaxID=3457785 RepID=UPI00403610C4